MGISVLGPVSIDGAPPLSRRDRIVLSVLVVRRDEVTSADQVADALWPDGVPESGRKIVQGAITRLRKRLGHEAIETTSGGYRLRVGPDDIDAWRFQRLVDRATGLAETGEHDRACDELARAGSLWRGEPFAELDGWAAGAAEATRMLELRRFAEERHAEARLALGDHDAVAAQLRAMVAAEPLREQRWALLATSLYRSGRQGEALRALHEARRVLANELGVPPGAALVALEQAILQQDRALDAPQEFVAAPQTACPYKGLEAYQDADTDLFFGREDETEACCRRVVESGFLALIGASGSGKSSLARAGIAPRLRSLDRRVAVCTPGADPAAAFAAARAAVGRDGVVLVDQGEELFTVCTKAERREAFAAVLAAHATTGGVVWTLRADYITDVATYPQLARLVERSVYLLGPMGEPALSAAIAGPAGVAGLRLEAGLVGLLVNDVVDQPGALPLLSHALAETWRRREGRVLTVAAYRAGGGVRGAVARTAEQVYDALPERKRGAVRVLFLRLVSVLGDGEAVRHRVARSMLAEEQNDVVDMLVQARLLTVDEGSLEIAHEALARAWPRLQRWLQEDGEGQRVLTHLSASAHDWNARGRDPDELYRGARLHAAEEWAQRHTVDLSSAERAFLDASIAAHDAQAAAAEARRRAQVRANHRLRQSLRAVAALLVVALVATALAALQARRAGHERDRAGGSSRAAELQNVVSQSLALRGTKRDLSALLALEAYRMAPSAQTESAVLATFTGTPGFLGYLHGSTPFWSGALDATGDRLVVADGGSTLRVFDTDRMALTRTITDPHRRGSDGLVAITRDGATVVVASATGPDASSGGDLSAYDARSGRARFAGVKLAFPPGAVALSPDGTLVAVSGGPAGDAEIHDGRTGTLVARLARPPAGNGPNSIATAAVAFASDTRLVVGSEAGLIRVVDPRRGIVVRSISGRAGLSEEAIDVAPDGNRLLTLGASGRMMLLDLRTGRELWPAPSPSTCNRAVPAFRFGFVLCADAFGRVLTVDLATGVATGTRFDFQQGFVSQLAVSGDGRTLALVGGTTATAALWRLDGSGAITQVVGTPGDSAVGYDVSGRMLLVSNGGHLRVISPIDGHTIDSGDAYSNGVWSGAPGTLAVLFTDGSAGLYDVARHRRVPHTTIALDIEPVLALSDDSHDRVILFDDRGRVRAYRGGRSVAPHLDLPGSSPTSAGITPDGRFLVVVWDRSEAETYDTATGKRVAGPNSAIGAVAVGSDGTTVGAAPDGAVTLYDPRTLRPRGALPSAFGAADSLRFDDDAGRLLVESGDRTLRLIDVATGTTIGDPIPVGEHAPPFGTGGQLLRPDGNQISATADGGVAIWDVDPQRLLPAACVVAGRNLTRSEWDKYLGALGPYRPTCTA